MPRSSLPLLVPLPGAPDPGDLLEVLRGRSAHPVLLESTDRRHPLGRWSFLAWDPWDRIVAQGHPDPFGALESALGRWRKATLRAPPRAGLQTGHPGAVSVAGTPDLPPFQGGAIGLVTYEAGCRTEGIATRPAGTPALPDLWFGLFDLVIAWDHARDLAWIVASGLPEDGGAALDRARRRVTEAFRLLEGAGAPRRPAQTPTTPARLSPSAITSTFTREEYEAAVERVRAYIRGGDVFQVNLSQRFELDFEPDGVALFRALARANPAPFASYLDLGTAEVIGVSPERFLRVEGVAPSDRDPRPDRRVETRPIKGTRPRGPTAEEDAALARALTRSGKDRAENVMIVDLLRNDLSRVCRDHTVEVTALCEVESHPSVHHLVSAVEGRLRPGVGPAEILRATFPGGSITGAPKLRAMEIIGELEPVGRGAYTGAIGWIGFDGSMDLNVAIRTATLAGGRLQVPAGGGIVLDSDPAAEYEETMAKARAILETALAVREGARRGGSRPPGRAGRVEVGGDRPALTATAANPGPDGR